MVDYVQQSSMTAAHVACVIHGSSSYVVAYCCCRYCHPSVIISFATTNAGAFLVCVKPGFVVALVAATICHWSLYCLVLLQVSLGLRLLFPTFVATVPSPRIGLPAPLGGDMPRCLRE